MKSLKMKTRRFALTALFITALIYGVTFTIAKEVMQIHIKPFGFILMRVAGAGLIFWGIGFLVKNAKTIEKQDFR